MRQIFDTDLEYDDANEDLERVIRGELINADERALTLSNGIISYAEAMKLDQVVTTRKGQRAECKNKDEGLTEQAQSKRTVSYQGGGF